MTATTIMSTDVVTIKPDASIAKALQLMCIHSVHNLPVVDDEGTFLGLFSLRRLSRELLPKAAKLNESRPIYLPRLESEARLAIKPAIIGNTSIFNVVF